MDKELERVRNLCSSLLSSLERQMRGGGMSYDERKGLKDDTKILSSKLDSELEVHEHTRRVYTKEVGKVKLSGIEKRFQEDSINDLPDMEDLGDC